MPFSPIAIITACLVLLAATSGHVASSETENTIATAAATVPITAAAASTKETACSIASIDKDIEEVAKTGSLAAILKVWQQFYQCKDSFGQAVDNVFATLSESEASGLELLVSEVSQYDTDLEHNVFLEPKLTWNALKKALQLGCLNYLDAAHSVELDSGEEAVAKVSNLLCMGVYRKLRPILALLSEVINDDLIMSKVDASLKNRLISARVCQRIVQYAALDV